MKANELRLGNLVSDINASDSFYAEVKRLDKNRCYYGQFHSAYSDLKPIPLTEEWLLKMGFERIEELIGGGINELLVFYTYKGIKIHSDISNKWLIGGLEFNMYRFDSVHQLQNLIHALTNEELTIK